MRNGNNWNGDARDIFRHNRDKDNKDFLKGCNAPDSLLYLTIVVDGVRKWEEYESSFIIDYHYPVKTRRALEEEDSDALLAKSWNVNITNARRLRLYLGRDNYNELVGASIRLRRVWQKNPRTEEIVPSFEVYAVRLHGATFVSVREKMDMEEEE